MAILQISRLQARRGLQQDLPQLASAEFGWSIDQRRLFIGNGLLGEGAPIEGVTEVLTQHTDLIDVIKFYIYKGNAAGYVALTGPANAPNSTVRSLQGKFDDYASIADFGGVGDGITNNLYAFAHAISELYKSTEVVNNTRTRRTLLVPAGTYIISGGVIKIPPWLRLVGDGIDSSIIVQDDDSQACLLQFCDSSFVTGISMGATPFIQLPTDVSIENLSLRTSSKNNVVDLDSAVNVNFRLVHIAGSVTNPGTPLIVCSAIKLSASKVSPDNITFDLCKFDSLDYGFVSDVASSNVRFNNCLWKGMYGGLRLGRNSSSNLNAPQSIRISNSVFRNISTRAIDAYSFTEGVVSTGNSYYNCGNNYIVNSPVTEIINFMTDSNYSINDYFDRPSSQTTIARVGFGTHAVIQINTAEGIRAGSAVMGPGSYVALNANIASPTSTGISVPAAGVINYSIVETSGNVIQFGSINVTAGGWSDDFNSTDDGRIKLAVTPNMTATGWLLVYTNRSAITHELSYNINHF